MPESKFVCGRFSKAREAQAKKKVAYPWRQKVACPKVEDGEEEGRSAVEDGGYPPMHVSPITPETDGDEHASPITPEDEHASPITQDDDAACPEVKARDLEEEDDETEEASPLYDVFDRPEHMDGYEAACSP